MNKEYLITTKKDKEEVLIWLKALRSGKYKQTTKRLQDNKGYCCLGVACKVLIPKFKQRKKGLFNLFGNLKGYMPFHQKFAPEWLMKISNYHRLNSTLVYLNDIEKKSFIEIADIIEQTLKPEMDLID